MKTIGYVCKSQMISQEQLQRTEIVLHENRFQTVDTVMCQLRPHVENFVDEIEVEATELLQFVDSVKVHVATNRAAEFLNFINVCSVDAILVRSFEMLSPSITQQLELLAFARGDMFQSDIPVNKRRRVLVVSLEQSSLLKLDIDIAFELQEQWVLAPMRKSIDENFSKADENYVKLRDLMLEKLTVEKIAERLGQSKSTIFRWRKQFEERLAQDIPGFKIGD